MPTAQGLGCFGSRVWGSVLSAVSALANSLKISNAER